VGFLLSRGLLGSTVADVLRDPLAGPLRRMGWQAPVWDPSDFAPGLVRAHVDFWADHVLVDHPIRDTLSYLWDGVDLYDLLLDPFKGPSSECPFDPARFPPRVFSNRIPPAFDAFVEAEMRGLIEDAGPY